ncbi:MAG: EAL domain-containing protein [Acidimicrobiales bacterium]|jgi:EAL domain-containing protein (putative c-di-GMP-specific phosphodiesterase class I)
MVQAVVYGVIEDTTEVSEQEGVSRDQIETVIEAGEIPIVWQPIVSLESREVLGYEALARFTQFSNRDQLSPVAWFSAASAFGLRESLEMVAVRSALTQLEHVPEGTFVSLNISPSTVATLELEEDLHNVASDRLVLEISEDAVTDAGDGINEALTRLREKGVRVALDDTGSGLVSLRQLLGVQADIIKIDTDVTRGVDTDVMKQAIAYALKSLAERSGAMSLAEGVETEAEAEMLASLGIEAAQGYLFGRPAELN